MMAISIRQGVRLICLVGIAGATTSFFTAAHADIKGREAVVWSPGGKYTTALQEIYVEPFEKATGAKIRLVEASVDEAMAAVSVQAKAGKVEWDALSSIDAPYIPRLIEEGVLQKVDASKMAGINKLPKAAVIDHGVAVLNSVVTVSYRSADGVTPLNSVKDFFDPNIKGARTMGSGPSQGPLVCILALASEGVSIEEMIKGIDVDRCLQIVSRVKDQVTAYWSNGSEMAQLQIDEEVDYCLCWDGRIIQAALANPKWKITHNGGIQFFTYFTYTKGTKNEDVLDAFVEYMLDPKLQAEFTKQLGYSAPNPESVAYLPEKLKPFVSVTPEAQGGLITVPDALNVSLASQEVAIGEAWQAFVGQ